MSEVTIVDGERCQSQFSNNAFNNHSSLCAENGHSATCKVTTRATRVNKINLIQGDSGGPLTVLDSGNKHTLVGVVSKRLFENNCNKVRRAIFI